MEFDMNRTWSQAIALAKANLQLLAIIAGVFLLLPSVLIYMAVPDMFALTTLGNDPEAMAAAMEGILVPLLIYGSIGFLAQMIGYVAMIALMGSERPTVGEALVQGLKALPTIIGAMILFMIGYAIIALVMGLLIGLLVVALGETAGGILTFAVVIALIVGVLYVMTRLSMTLPVIVLEREFNPIRDFTRSWKLTSDHAWRIFAFYVLITIAYFVLSLVIGGIFGVVASAIAAGTGSMLMLGIVNGLIGAAVAVVFSGILVSMHQQLSGQGGTAVRQTFE